MRTNTGKLKQKKHCTPHNMRKPQPAQELAGAQLKTPPAFGHPEPFPPPRHSLATSVSHKGQPSKVMTPQIPPSRVRLLPQGVAAPSQAPDAPKPTLKESLAPIVIMPTRPRHRRPRHLSLSIDLMQMWLVHHRVKARLHRTCHRSGTARILSTVIRRPIAEERWVQRNVRT